jgi:hypothetical protein
LTKEKDLIIVIDKSKIEKLLMGSLVIKVADQDTIRAVPAFLPIPPTAESL